MLTLQKWSTLEDSIFTAETLEALLRNDIPAIRISQFATVEECHKLAEVAELVGFDFYENVEPPIGRIGITQFEFGNSSKLGYFDAVHQADFRRQQIVSLSFDPLERLAMLLRQHTASKVGIAQENEQLGEYFAGLIRHINVALLHLDFAQLDAPDWEIGHCVAQLAWNLYLKVPKHGGECVVYNRQWCVNDQQYKLPGSYSYDTNLVKNSQAKYITPVLGDLVLFNSRNFHQVLPGEGERITMSSFIGKMPKGNLVFWS
ncbi:2OG-Fe(II) oxygenase [Microcoleus sp. F6_B4]|uniref:2OG-Fe(II)-dependent halogenase WelO5 family protein n=1 Tax=Microcoleus sp. B4-D4 TaxID=2818667 RepID=UPI002FD68BBE